MLLLDPVEDRLQLFVRDVEGGVVRGHGLVHEEIGQVVGGFGDAGTTVEVDLGGKDALAQGDHVVIG